MKYQDTTSLDTITIMEIEKITITAIIILLLDKKHLDKTLQRELLTTITIETTMAMADNNRTDQLTRDTKTNNSSRITTTIDPKLLSLPSLLTSANSNLAQLDRL